MTEARELTLHELLRCQHTKRWHIVHTDREETVACHQWGVWVLGRELYKRMDATFSRELWYDYCLLHDSTEQITGDIPTPAKRLLIGGGDTLGFEFSKEYAALELWAGSERDGLPAAMLKCCDGIAAVRHMDIHGRGAHARSVRVLLMRALRERTEKFAVKWPLERWQAVIDIFNEANEGPQPGGYYEGDAWRSTLALVQEQA